MNRLTDNDYTFGPLTVAKSSWATWSVTWSSGGHDDGSHRNTMTVYTPWFVARLQLPNLLSPYRIRHEASWDEETIARLGRNYYYETYDRDYGFRLTDGHLILYLGQQTNDSLSTKSWSCFLPWTQWRHVRYSRYGLLGEHFKTQGQGKWVHEHEAMEACPSVAFEFDDFDGQRIIATTRIEEREWHFGEGWCKWLSWFRRPKIKRSLDIHFSSEVGPEKGSWKGGTIGHGIEMLPGELHEQAFRRYCQMEHCSKYRKFTITFVGKIITHSTPQVA